MPSAQIKVERIYGPTRREIFKGLRAYNKSAAGKFDYRPLAITLRQRGAIVGGLLGETFWGWLFIRGMWLSEDYRKRGFGSKIMRAAESEARRRGVKQAYVDSFSFQAPGFYRKLGYREFGRLKEFPAGHYRSWLTKAL